MAVPFYVPETGSSTPATSAATSSSTTSTTVPQPHNPSVSGGNGSATAIHHHTMPMSPVNSEYLVQAFCEALTRYSQAGGSLTTPPSPTLCSYGNSDVYFNFNNIHDEFYGSPRRFRSHSLSIPPTSRTLSDDEDFSEPNYMDEHNNYTTASEQLLEFPGRVPQRKKKSTATDLGNLLQQQKLSEQKHKSKPKEQNFVWPTLVCLGVLAIGCGLLATR
ncbi:hypothetical protein PVAND_011228 [Polypedilum vanderplanki]|uniref:Uncharacterized protein n=1 Tax=Polypedilum vanderplanki TaxID=319348 RepID=A0A9J6CIG6_POLVA|nr:hypothetical protein PVAND_011228 [Polypedilum vanderplanki]